MYKNHGKGAGIIKNFQRLLSFWWGWWLGESKLVHGWVITMKAKHAKPQEKCFEEHKAHRQVTASCKYISRLNNA